MSAPLTAQVSAALQHQPSLGDQSFVCLRARAKSVLRLRRIACFAVHEIMVFFNDPVPIPDPAARAVNMAVAMREVAGELIASWRR